MSRIDLSGLRKYTVMFVLLALMGLFTLASPYFLTWRNITNIVMQNTYFIIVAVGLSFVMIGGGIDLSVGYQMSLVGVVTAMLMVAHPLPVWFSVLLGLLLGAVTTTLLAQYRVPGWLSVPLGLLVGTGCGLLVAMAHVPVWLAVLIGIFLGIALGTINGLVVTRIRIFPLIATLATSVIFQGISYLLSQAKTYRNYPEQFLFITKYKVLGMPFDVFLTLLIVIVASIIYYETVFGLRVMALGGNEEASRLSGIDTRSLRVVLYAICGFLTAVATMVMISKANTTHSSFGPGTEFTALTAAIVGGISFMGGEGNMPALVAGVFVLAVLGNGMQLAGWGTYPQYIIRGLILLGAVAFDEYQRSARRAGHKSRSRPTGGVEPDDGPIHERNAR